jgi:hypothetical protein
MGLLDIVKSVVSKNITTTNTPKPIPPPTPAPSFVLPGTPVSTAPDLKAIRDAIGKTETEQFNNDLGKAYSFSRYSGDPSLGNALGRYQITEKVLQEKGKQYLGYVPSTKEFLSTPSLQDKFMDAKLSDQQKQGADLENLIVNHNKGINSVPTDAPGYLNKVKSFLPKATTSSGLLTGIDMPNIAQASGSSASGNSSPMPLLNKLPDLLKYVTGVDVNKVTPSSIFTFNAFNKVPNKLTAPILPPVSPLVKDVVKWTFRAGIPAGTAISELASGIGEGAYRLGQTFSPLEALKAVISQQGTQDITQTPIGQSYLGKKAFGTEPTESLLTTVARREQTFKPYVGKSALPLAIGATALEQYFNFDTGGGKSLVELLAKETDPGIISKLLKRTGLPSEFIGKASEDLSKINNPEEVRNYLTVLKNDIVSPAISGAEKLGLIRSVKDIPMLEMRVAEMADLIQNNPLAKLDKYANKIEGKLGEVLGKGKSIWSRKGDQITQELSSIYPHLPSDTEELRTAYEQFVETRKEYKALKGELQLLKSTPEAKLIAGAERGIKKVKEYSDATIERINKKIQMFNDKIGTVPELPKQEIYKPEQAIFDAGVINAKRAQDYQVKLDAIKAQLDEVVMGRAKKNGGIWNQLKTFLNPVKQLDPETQGIYKQWTRDVLSAKELANAEIAKYKIPNKEGLDIIRKYQAGEKTPYSDQIKQAFDSMFREANQRGLTVHYWPDYLPQVYKESPDEIKASIIKYLRDNGVADDVIHDYSTGKGSLPSDVAYRLKINPTFSKERVFPDYETAMKFGLTPRYTNPAQLIAYYRGEMEKSIANRAFVEKLAGSGKIFPTSIAPDAWKEINLPFAGEKYSAPKDIANMLNGVFRNNEDLTFGESVFKGLSWLNRSAQELALSAGIPKTNMNFFTFGQLIKEITSGNLKAVVPFVRSQFNEKSIAYFASKQPILKLMADEGIDIGSRIGTYSKVYKNLLEKKTFTQWAGESFDKLFNEKTFASFMPQLYVDTFERAYNSGIKKGLNTIEARQLAGQTTKTFYGLIENVGRSRLSQDVINSVFFAPRFRESLINMLVNTAKSVTTEFRNPAYKLNRRFLAGATASYVLYNALNKKLTGHYMWQNEPGKEFELTVPMPNGDRTYVALLPSVLSLPRNLGSGFIALAKGDLNTAEQKFGSAFSMPLKIMSEVLSNQDYFGRTIYKDTDPGMVKLQKIAEYVGLQVNHPYIKELYNRVLKPMWDKNYVYNKSVPQSIIEALEFPLKFKTKDQIASSEYFNALDKQIQERADIKNKVKPIYDRIQKLRDSGNDAEAQTLLDSLTDDEYAIYKDLRTADKSAQTKKAKKMVFGKYKQIQSLLASGDTDKAQEILNSLTDQEYKAYKLLKDNNTPTE